MTSVRACLVLGRMFKTVFKNVHFLTREVFRFDCEFMSGCIWEMLLQEKDVASQTAILRFTQSCKTAPSSGEC